MKIAKVGDNIRYFDKTGLWKLILDAEQNNRNRSVYSDRFKESVLDKQKMSTRYPVTMEMPHRDMAELRLQIGYNDKGDHIWLDCDFDLVEEVSKWTGKA